MSAVGPVGLVARTEIVDVNDWRAAVSAAVEAGFTFLHVLDAVDDLGRAATITVTCRLLRFGPAGNSPEAAELRCPVSRADAVVPSIADLIAGAEWYEREVHDFFGVCFAGGSDEPLLNHNPAIRPLRKDFVLAARVAAPWPGAKEPGEGASGAPSRRRMAPVGVPDPDVFGARPPGAEAPDADELVASLSGGRVRRRR